ncbi:MBL fold metallo-hydrolase [Taibaiella soli]|uniref:MBL fold metallo-hydrolase n=1 Tax=Taibaiella soli TaxID=1649169 RepID=A0A2W2BZ65_9BACT|nr:MBL fold metallo-hydrolase [Taibaiella soli]PZF73133.1 MBL fold metallo-hydrolase [Taibaiella soli]
MIVEQLYTNCLSEAAYFIASEGEAAVIDPLRDVDVYLKMAEEKGVKIKYIFETHFHADFVSGHLELARKTGAPIIYGPQTNAKFNIRLATDGEEFPLGKAKIKAIHTPGHTVESTCYLLEDETGAPYSIFTGDTLFVGDVGRPDLFSGDLSKEDLAGMMYESLQNKIKTLPDNVIVYPAHGPGSACGKNLGSETFSTIGQQKQSNYALQEQTKEEFVKAVTEGLSAPPAYFPLNARINKEGYETLDDVMSALEALTPEEFKKAAANGALILDTRPSTVFTEGFVPESISIGLDGRFAEWAGSLLPFDQPIILVTEAGKEKESVIRLARVGLDKVIGYLEGGYAAWVAADERIDMIIDIEPEELAMDIPHDNKLEVIDVRKPGEFNAGHVQGAVNVPLDTLADVTNIAMIDGDANLYIHCAGGYRSVIAASLLKRQGFHNLRNVLGGFGKIKAVKGMPIVNPDLKKVN